jgi:hypothetical protein
MLIIAIENKLIDMLTEATIDDVSTYVVKGIHDFLLDWEEYEEYPRIVVACEEMNLDTQMIGGAVTKEYVVNIFILCYDKNKEECLTQRDTVLERVEICLRSNQRLDNLADNTNTERVYGSELGRTRLSKSGMAEDYHSVAWVQFRVFTDRNIPV